MAQSSPRPLWGWTATARAWMTLCGALIASGLLLRSGSWVSDGPPNPGPRLVVDPNTAPPEVLDALPRLGPAIIGRLVAAREQAPFVSLDDLDDRVRGIGPATLAGLRPFLHIKRTEVVRAVSPPAVAATLDRVGPDRIVRSP